MTPAVILMKAVFDVSFLSSVGGFFERIKSTQNNHPTVNVDISDIDIVSIAFADTSNSASVIASDMEVSHIGAAISSSEIAATIIGSDSIDMVNFNWSFPSDHSPDKSVGKIANSKDTYPNVASASNAFSRLVGITLVPSFALSCSIFISRLKHLFWALFPSKDASLRIVVKDFAKVVSGWYSISSHIGLRHRSCGQWVGMLAHPYSRNHSI